MELVRTETRAGVEEVLGLVVLVARLEQLTRQLYTRLLDQRETAWAKLRQDSVERMEELADVFGGKQKLSRIQPNKRLERWLLDRAGQIKTLELENPAQSARLAVQLIQAEWSTPRSLVNSYAIKKQQRQEMSLLGGFRCL